MKSNYDALLIASFGGPEGMDEVMPFLDNVLRGKNIPEARKKQVAHHYEMFGGVSPINSQNRELRDLLEKKFQEKGIHVPVFWGNRNWKPYFKDALLLMKEKGIQKALVYITSAYGSYSGCRQYLENFEQARMEAGEGAPTLQRLKLFYDHPNFIQVNAQHILDQLKKIPSEEINDVHLVFTAHSIPIASSDNSPYVDQLQIACKLTAQKTGIDSYKLVYQSRSGAPTTPWLGPDICDYLEQLKKQNIKNVIICPIGFVSDHMEVLYDLDTEAKKKAIDLGIHMYRASSAGNHPLMIEMIAGFVQDQLSGTPPFVCAPDCCKPVR